MSAVPVLLADANVFLRFLRNDHPAHSAGARQLMEAAARGQVVLRVKEVAVVDTFYTLTAPRMGVARAPGARQLAALLQQPGVDLENAGRVLEILTICEVNNVDYCDAALIVESRKEKHSIVSYDRDFAKAPDVTAITPIDWIKANPPNPEAN